MGRRDISESGNVWTEWPALCESCAGETPRSADLAEARVRDREALEADRKLQIARADHVLNCELLFALGKVHEPLTGMSPLRAAGSPGHPFF